MLKASFGSLLLLVATGAIGSWRELALAFTGYCIPSELGPWGGRGELNIIAMLWSVWMHVLGSIIRSGAMGDAESSAAIGLTAVVLAGVFPRRGPLRPAWVGALLGFLVAIALASKLVVLTLGRVFPPSLIFHDPRRWLGVAQWLLVLMASMGAGELLNAVDPSSSVRRRLAPAWALLVILGVTLSLTAPFKTVIHALPVALLLASASFPRFNSRRWKRACLLAALALLGHSTWKYTDLKTLEVDELLKPNQPALIQQAGLKPGERFFSIDVSRETSYRYQRPDRLDAALPNMAMLWDLEDLGGYEPAQSRRYRRYLADLHRSAWPPPYAEHFGRIQNPLATLDFDRGNVRAALMPRFGVPMHLALQFKPEPRNPVRRIIGPFPSWFREPFDAQIHVVPLDPSKPVLVSLLTRIDGRQTSTALSLRDLALGDDWARRSGSSSLPAAEPAFPKKRQTIHGIDHQPGMLVAEYRMPPVTDPEALWAVEDTNGHPDDIFVWNPELTRAWQPQAASPLSFAVLMRYRGSPNWTEWREGQGRVLRQSIRANRLDLELETVGPGGGALTIADAWWPGWRATLDGTTRIPIEQAGLWRAVRLPAGRHHLTMAYHPTGWTASLGITAVSALVLAWIALNARRRKLLLEAQHDGTV